MSRIKKGPKKAAPTLNSNDFYYRRQFKFTGRFNMLMIMRETTKQRRSIASQALNAGVSLDRISAALGHSNLEITRRYASLNVQKLIDVVDGFGQDSDKQKIREINPRIIKRKMERATGLEPATPSLGSLYSTN